MTGGVRGRLETALSQGGERLQPPWLPHAMEGGGRGGRRGRGCDRPITCESSVSSSYALQIVEANWHMSRLCQRFTRLPSTQYEISVPPCVSGMSHYLLPEDYLEPTEASSNLEFQVNSARTPPWMSSTALQGYLLNLIGAESAAPLTKNTLNSKCVCSPCSVHAV